MKPKTCTYKGSFKNDMFHGKGIYKFATGMKTYDGEFFENKMQGRG